MVIFYLFLNFLYTFNLNTFIIIVNILRFFSRKLIKTYHVTSMNTEIKTALLHLKLHTSLQFCTIMYFTVMCIFINDCIFI